MAIRTRFTHRSRCFLPSVFVLAAIFSLRISDAVAQWRVIGNFGAQVSSVYFLDQQGAPATGFVGLATSSIWRTTDNGKTWNAASTPFELTSVEITDFAFSDSMLGWCSVRLPNDSFGEIWKTTNGGLNWSSIYSRGAFVSIAYSPATGILVAPSWTYDAVRSTDSGVTWARFEPPWQNGATFSGLNGVIGIISAPYPLYTHDGGQTWNQTTGFDDETWAPHGIPGSAIFVAVGEKSGQFYRSTDGGESWTSPYAFPQDAHPTGCIMGTQANLLFVQTENHGFYFSNDTGKTWTSVCGPSSYSLDTRFYTKGREVFAGDFTGHLWYTPDGLVMAIPTLDFDRNSLSFSGTRCASYDSAFSFEYGSGCDTAELLQAQIVTGASTFSLGTDSLPVRFSGVDSVIVLYSPSANLRDSGRMRLEFQIGADTVDTVIALYGASKDTSKFTPPGPTALSSTYACVTVDSTLVLHNESCDTLTFFRASFGNNPVFQLLPLKLPVKIAPFDSAVFTVAASSPQDGSFRAVLVLTMLDAGSLVTDSVPVSLTVLRGGKALFSSLEISMPYACHAIDTAFSITNSQCDSITLLAASLNDTSVFRMAALTSPDTILAGGAIHLPIHIVPGAKGTSQAILHLRYVSGQTTVDTTITLSLQVLYDLPLHVDLADSAFDLGSAYIPCQTASRWITFHNGLCRTLTIDRISWVNPNNQFSFDSILLPDTLASDTGADSVLVHFTPDLAIRSSNELRITLDMGGTAFDTVLPISGMGVLAYHDTVLTPTLQYDSIAQCLASKRDGEIVNLSCDSIIALGASVAGGQGYSVTGPKFPVSLGQGDTLRVGFQLQPKQTGPASDFAIITLHDLRNDSDYMDTIALTGYVLAGRQALSLNSSAFLMPSIAACSVLDSFLVVTNRGCDDVIIEDTSLLGYAGLQFSAPLVLPLILPPDSSVLIPFRIVPNRDTLERTALTLKGQHIDTTITFAYAALPGVPSLVVSMPDSVFSTRPCVPVSRTFWVANTGCVSASLDSLALDALSGSTQFTLQNPPTLPVTLAAGDTLHFTIQFDPNGNGNGLATLDLESQGAKFARSIGLTGDVLGTVPTARVALEASDGSSQSSGMANQFTSVVAKLLDDIGDTTALSTVTITLNANWNLLTPATFSPAPGWSVVDTKTLANGDFQIRIRHDAMGAVSAGTPLVTTSFYITTSDSTGCDIGLSNVRFNDSSPNYEDCVLSSIAAPVPVRFTEIDTCGTPELRLLMEGRLVLRIISVIPNPAPVVGGASRMNVNFDLTRAGNVQMTIQDAIGREYVHTTQSFTAGVHTARLQVPGAAEGMYFIQLESDGQTAEAKAIVQNDGGNLGK